MSSYKFLFFCVWGFRFQIQFLSHNILYRDIFISSMCFFASNCMWSLIWITKKHYFHYFFIRFVKPIRNSWIRSALIAKQQLRLFKSHCNCNLLKKTIINKCQFCILSENFKLWMIQNQILKEHIQWLTGFWIISVIPKDIPHKCYI